MNTEDHSVSEKVLIYIHIIITFYPFIYKLFSPHSILSPPEFSTPTILKRINSCFIFGMYI